jgi:hypothetical protein
MIGSGGDIRRGPADREGPLHRRRVRLAQSLGVAVRRRPVSRLRASRRLLAREKMRSRVRDAAYRLIPYLSVGLLVFLIVVFVYALAENLPVMGRSLEPPYLFIFPVVGALAAIVLAVSVRRRSDGLPYTMS